LYDGTIYLPVINVLASPVMSGLVQSVQWAWGISVGIALVVLGLLFFRGYFRNLPVFTAFVAANVCQWGLLYVIYLQFGIGSRTALVLAWISEACILLLRTLAAMEVLHRVLGPYPGIWGLGWRVLALAFFVVISYAAIEAGQNISAAIGLADRGFHLAFAVALVACLLMIRYYSIPVDPPYKALLGGFCVYSCTVVLANTIARVLFLRGFANIKPIWQFTLVAAYAGVQGAWAAGLWNAAPAMQGRPALLGTSVYRQISPEINERLRFLNGQLSKFWEAKAARQ
jgi:hypothetical protein